MSAPELISRVAGERQELGRHTARHGGLRAIALCFAVWVFLVISVLCLQFLGGTYQAELGGYPDEASHYVSGVLLHDYIKAGVPSSPVRFTEQFYLHYPYLAIGHWPPGFYALEGVWMLLFSTSRISVLVLMALITATLAFSLYFVARMRWSILAALLSALLLIGAPLIQQYCGMVMADTLLALLCFWAVFAEGEYIRTGEAKYSIAFTVLGAAAIGTKANGFFLALVPAFTVVLTRRFKVLRNIWFWVPAAVIGVVCLPWHLMTAHMMLPTFNSEAGWKFVARSSAFYARESFASLGLMILTLVAVGLYFHVLVPAIRSGVEPALAAQAALLLSYFAFYCTIPAGIEHRYFIVLIPALLLFANAGAQKIASLGTLLGVDIRQIAVLAVAAVVFACFTFYIPKKSSRGYNVLAAAIDQANRGKRSVVLVSTETNSGEGVFVSEMAMRRPTSEAVVFRGSKVLADQDWNNTTYAPRYKDAEQLRHCLNKVGIDYLAVDMRRGAQTYLHHQQLLDLVSKHGDEWQMVTSVQDHEGHQSVALFHRTANSVVGDPLQNIRTNLNGQFGTWPVTISFACDTRTGSAPQ